MFLSAAEYRGFSSGKALNCKHKAWALKVGQENLSDGRVEAVFEGDKSAVQKLVDYCRHGPTAAKVENIEINHEKYKGEFSGFETF
jgi:acylphosphatase